MMIPMKTSALFPMQMNIPDLQYLGMISMGDEEKDRIVIRIDMTDGRRLLGACTVRRL